MEGVGEDCKAWKAWSHGYWRPFAIYVGFAVLFGIIAGAVTLTTKANLPAAGEDDDDHVGGSQGRTTGKSMYSMLKLSYLLISFSVVQLLKSRRISFRYVCQNTF